MPKKEKTHQKSPRMARKATKSVKRYSDMLCGDYSPLIDFNMFLVEKIANTRSTLYRFLH
jgi:hypothetical protein